VSPLLISIAGRKGGAGKTTTALNLAGALALCGERVLLVDMDPQASLTRMLLAGDAFGLAGIGERMLKPQLGVADLVRHVRQNIDIVPGDASIEATALALAHNPTYYLRLRGLLAGVPDYAYVILDTPPALGFALNAALLSTTIAIMPTELAQQDFDALEDTILLREELAPLQAARLFAIVPSRVASNNHDNDGVQALRATYGDLVAEPVRQAVAVERAGNRGLSVVEYDPESAPAAAYRQLADSVRRERACSHAG
jgi:chromosome partitioning protein